VRKALIIGLLITFVVAVSVFHIVYRACLMQRPGLLWGCVPMAAEIIGHQLRERLGP